MLLYNVNKTKYLRKNSNSSIYSFGIPRASNSCTNSFTLAIAGKK